MSSIVVSGPETVSQLLIQSAMVKDTGIYTCHLHYGHRPDVNNKLRDTINVHVLQGNSNENSIQVFCAMYFSNL